MIVVATAAVWLVTMYAPGSFQGRSCGATGLTRAGTSPVAGHAVAADPRVLPIGSIIEIEGLGRRQVHDTGGAVKGRHIDVYVDSCAQAIDWGVKRRAVRILHRGGSK